MGSAADRRTNAMPAASLIRELAEIADYIAHLRDSIQQLRANELTRDRLPMVHEELGQVVTATASATNTIMETAESILGLAEDERYREAVEARVFAIFEACAFQDLTGQRIAKVAEAMSQLETRLSRFAAAVKARDANGLDPVEVERRMRADLLLLNGPQKNGPATPQDAIDALFA